MSEKPIVDISKQEIISKRSARRRRNNTKNKELDKSISIENTHDFTNVSKSVTINSEIDHPKLSKMGLHNSNKIASTTNDMKYTSNIESSVNKKSKNIGRNRYLLSKPGDVKLRQHINQNYELVIKHENEITNQLIYQLSTNKLDCIICFNNVNKSPIWSCEQCYTIFHLSCVNQWTKSIHSQIDGIAPQIILTATPNTSTGNIINKGIGWRCPACQTQQMERPKYSCYCKKSVNPNPQATHSLYAKHCCDSLCGKNLNIDNENCNHKCSYICHPGPCDPCNSNCLTICYCGKNKKLDQCTKFAAHFSCSKSCDKLLDCGIHKCTKICHIGPCSPCDIYIDESCHCGRNSRSVTCIENLTHYSAISFVEEKKIDTYYSCLEHCDQKFDCGFHRCEQLCHVIDKDHNMCPKHPTIFPPTCNCGKTSAKKIRQKCTDEIQTCGQICFKELNCGSDHLCLFKCHDGPCPPCSSIVSIKCRCGNTKIKRICTDNKDDIVCTKLCLNKLSCYKHKCLLTCCLKTKEIHICLKKCNKRLECKLHICYLDCHSDPCPPCLEASFDDWACPCGNTVLQAPIRCNVRKPICQYPCIKSRKCGHQEIIKHSCHGDDIECPKCVFLVSRDCVCKKQLLRNVACSNINPFCGLQCDIELRCGHACLNLCHVHSENTGLNCDQRCTNILECGHQCSISCHFGTLCTSMGKKCDTVVDLTCLCGNIKKSVSCSKSNDINIECSAECLKIKRQNELKVAFQIDQDNYISPFIVTFDEYLINFAPCNLDWLKIIESKINRFLVSNDSVLRFPAMNKAHRKVLHCLATSYNIDSVAIDPEPNRSVNLHKRQDSAIPKILASVAWKNPGLFTTKLEIDDEKDKMLLIKKSHFKMLFSYDPPPISQEILSYLNFYSCKDSILVIPNSDNPFSELKAAFMDGFRDINVKLKIGYALIEKSKSSEDNLEDSNDLGIKVIFPEKFAGFSLTIYDPTST